MSAGSGWPGTEQTRLAGRIETGLGRLGSASAVVWWGPKGDRQQLSGDEVHTLSMALAEHLTAAATPGAPVGVLAHRGGETVIAVLACLRAGLPWLPLEPSLPDTQIVERLRHGRAGLVAVPGVQRRRGVALATEAGMGCVAVATSGPKLVRQPAARQRSTLSVPAGYLVQTSGTTGEPKTIAVPYAALENYLDAALPLLGGTILSGERVGVLTTLAADLGYTVLFGALCAGAELHLVPEDTVRDPAAFLGYQRDQRLALYKTTPSHLRALLEADGTGDSLPTRLLVCGGEAFTEELAADLFARRPRCQILNHYGPAETCIGVAVGDVRPGQAAYRSGDPVTGPAGRRVLPVGRAIPGARITIVDERGEPLPAGETGEVVVAGAPVGWGYVGAPGATAERFGPDPAGAGERAYRTGDAGFLTAAGELVVTGRLDRQRKIRGQRVEPEGVEAVLRATGLVTDAVVDVVEAGELGDILVAWAVPRAGASVEQLRSAVTDRVPDHLVPGRLVLVPRLPRTANNKVDRAALPPVSAAPAAHRSNRGPLDRTIAILSELLGVTTLEPDDDVLTKGLHSLAAVRAATRLNDHFGADLGVSDVYRLRTPRALASRLAAARPDQPAPRPARHLELPTHLGTETAQDATPAPVAESPTGYLPQQQAIWLDELRRPGTGTYRVPLRWSLYGSLDPGALDRSYRQLVERHPALRLRVSYAGDQPSPVVVADPGPGPRSVDLTGTDEATADRAVTNLLGELAAAPLDPERDPPLRAILVTRGPDRHELLLCVHHGGFDGRSADVFIAELLAGLDGAPPGTPPPVRAVPPAAARSTPRSLPAPASFGLDAPEPGAAPARQSRAAQSPIRAQVDVPETSWAAVERVAAMVGLSTFAVLLAAWALVLSRQAGERRFAVATPVDLRADHGVAEPDPVIGCFVNTVPVAVDVDPSKPLTELLRQVGGAIGEALDDRLRPYGEHVAAVRREHGADDVARTMLTVEVTEECHGPGVRAVRRAVTVARAVTDLDLLVTRHPGQGLRAILCTGPGVCGPEAAQALLDQFRTALAGLGGDLAAPARRLTRLSAEQRARLVALGAGPVARPRPEPMRQLWEQAARRPAAEALSWPGGGWSYRELAGAVDGCRQRLAEHGVGPGDLVGVAVPRSPELVVLWWALLASGAVVVALDPAAPDERLLSAVAVTRPKLVVAADERLAPACPVLPLAALGIGEPGAPVQTRPPVPAAGEAPAYVILTSGSTGVPGAVAVSWAGLANHLGWMDHEFRLGPGDRVLLHTSPGFDVAVWELLGPIGAGAGVVLPEPAGGPPPTDRSVGTDVEALARCVVQRQVTVMQTVPALLQALLTVPEFVSRSALRLILCGGEEMPPSLAAECTRRLPGALLVNAYGPTETAIDATRRLVGHHEPVGTPARVPIGRPIAGASVYVVDDEGELVPPGAVGQLAIGGAGVALGYLGAARRTADRFPPDPYGGVPGGRLFLTGDLVRWTTGRELEYLGRIDNQIQVRGQRIELEEVEAALVAHPTIREAVVDVDGTGASAVLVARVVTAGSESPSEAELREHLAATLPAAAVPARYLLVAVLPRSTNGKVDRAAASRLAGRPLRQGGTSLTAAQERIAGIWAELLGAPASDPDLGFFAAGGNSLLVLRLRNRLADEFDASLSVADLFAHATIRAQAALLTGVKPERPTPAALRRDLPESDGAIAVIGMACRAPGARNVEEYWRNLCRGVESVRRFDREELLRNGVPASLVDDPRYVPVCAPLDDPYDFDALFFRIADHEMSLVSPQHRLLLDCAWQALESAGLLAERATHRIGVFAGASEEGHLPSAALATVDPTERIAHELGSSQDFLATRVAHLLDLRGPALSVRTACSTSLVAVHLAVQSLRDGECDVALAGGVALRYPVVRGHLHESGGIYSADGRCRPYDAAASGIVSGDGVGVVVLKPLAAALADNDAVLAVIRGTAVNNDGADKSGFTAPSVSGQAEVVHAALRRAGIDPTTIGYVEGHGTGTALGDPIEVQALRNVWRAYTDEVGICSLGSVKANIGHLDAAAGVLGLIKACLAVARGQLPGIPSLDRANPALALADSPFVVHRETRPWPAGRAPRRASVHSLGLGGTNAHAVVEEPPPPDSDAVTADQAPPLIVPLSAPSPAAVADLATRFAEVFTDGPAAAEPVAAAWTAQRARSAFPLRRAEVGRSAEELREALQRERRPVDAAPRGVVLMFPGGGSHRPGAGRRLHETVEPFRRAITGLVTPVRDVTGLDLRDLLWGGQQHLLDRPSYGFVASTAFSLAMAQALTACVPAEVTVLGYSLGELAAAAAAGIFGPAEMLRVAQARGAVFERMPPSGSTYVAAAAEQVRPMMGDRLTVGVYGGPADCVVAGDLDELAAFERRLDLHGVDYRRIAVPGAVHSPLLDPFLDDYQEAVRQARPGAPRVPLVSNVTGRPLGAQEAVRPQYWARQLRAPVRFGDCLRAVTERPAALIDVGPGRSLYGLAQSVVDQREVVACATSGGNRDGRPEELLFAACLATLWEHGVDVDWSRWPGPAGRRVCMPVAALDRRPYPPPASSVERHATSPASSVERRAISPASSVERRAISPASSVERRATSPARTQGNQESPPRLWRRMWRQLQLPPAPPAAPYRCVVLGDARRETYVAAAERLGIAVEAVDTVEAAIAAVEVPGAAPPCLIDLRPLAGAEVTDLLALAALIRRPVTLCAPTEGGADVLGTESLDPAAAMVAAACLTVRQERPAIGTVTVDLTAAGDPADVLLRLLGRAELPAQVAVRGTSAWEPVVVPVEDPAPATAAFRPDGIYLITGGLGRYGRWVAECIAEHAPATVVLLQRGGLRDHPDPAEVRRRVSAVERITRAGASVEVVACDVADEAALARAIAKVETRHGPVTGVIHTAGDIVSEASFNPLGDLVAAGLRDGFAAHAAAKVTGTDALDRVLAGRQLDFVVLMSSNAALLGGPGLALYGPVNAYQHLYAERRRRTGGPWTAIGWDGWRLSTDEPTQRGSSSLERYAIDGRSAFELLCRAINGGVAGVYVSRGDLAERYAHWAPGVGVPLGGSAAPDPAPDDPEEPTGVGPDPSDPETVIRGIWAELVGGPMPDPDDDLFHAGGTSLTIMRIRARLRDRLGVDVRLADLLENRTVAGMTALISRSPALREPDRGLVREVAGELETDIFALLGDVEGQIPAGGRGGPSTSRPT